MSESKRSSFLLRPGEQVMKVIPLNDRNLVLVQSLAKEKAQSTLYAFQLSPAKELWQEDIAEQITGWPSLQAVVDGKVCFTAFPDPSLPASEGLYLYDLAKRVWIYQSNDYSFIRVSGKEILMRKKNDEEQFYLLNLQTMEVNLSKALKSMILNKETEKGVLYPYHIGEENPLYKELTLFVQEKAAHSLVGMVEYAEWEGKCIVLSYYVQHEKELEQYLLVTNADAEVLWHECIDKHLKGMALDVFTIVKSQCLYVKDKNQFCLYDLR